MEDQGTPGTEDVSALLRMRLPDTPLTDLLDRVTQLACRTIPDCGLAGITMSQNGAFQTPVYTDPRAPRVDQAQYDHDSGPCLDAYRTGEVFTIADTVVDARWPHFSKAAAQERIRSTLSVPMDVSGNCTEVVGALNLYSEAPDAFGAEAVASTQSFAQQAALVVANAQAYWGAKAESAQLQQAMESRAVIEQAKGVLMAQSGIDAERAFEALRGASQRENRKLRDIAGEIVRRATQPRS